MRLEISKEELRDLLINLDQCECEGYISYGDPCYFLLRRLEKIKFEEEQQKDGVD
jgi:hypothetical protein